MSKKELVSEEIANIIDLLEQVKDVNKMIKIHQESDDDFMLNQYKHRKEKFLVELKELLGKFDISADLAA